ncbi:unnamed protein product [Phytomonas sp. EM1]|nr:unnamed protein product [Phytomonas sp. EM1]|eukprot:CCW65482.1 unnamed protein product [Phytomonas sp. isolate EM1]
MESFKDVLLSQPPAMYSQPANANIYLENYKGILLCGRPTLSVNGKNDFSLSNDAGGANHDRDFSPANRTGNPLGLGPSAEFLALRERNQALRAQNQGKNRSKSQQILSRHRRWLHSFAKQLKSMKQADLDREVEAARRAARLREAAIQRYQISAAENDDGTNASQQPQPAPYNPNKALDPFASSSRDISGSKPKPAKEKPKWAMTEDEAFEAELNENNSLLQFARNLDYDRFIGDFEVAEALSVMRDRVRKIAQANNWSEEDIQHAANHNAEDDLQSTVAPSEGGGEDGVFAMRQSPEGPPEARAALPARAAVHQGDWDNSTKRGRVLKRAISKDALLLAERLLAVSPSMQKIHTKQSLARVLQQCALQGEINPTEEYLFLRTGANIRHNRESANELAGMTTEELAVATAIGPVLGEEPKIVQLRPGDVSSSSEGNVQQVRILRELQQSRDRVQGLPYLYRCPAI